MLVLQFFGQWRDLSHGRIKGHDLRELRANVHLQAA